MGNTAPSTAAKSCPTRRTRVRPKHESGRYDHETVCHILDTGLLCQVGYAVDGQPYATPTAYLREGDRGYWHGSCASRMLRRLEEGVPVPDYLRHLAIG